MHKRLNKMAVLREFLYMAQESCAPISTRAIASGEARDMVLAALTYGPHVCIIRRTVQQALEIQVRLSDGILPKMFYTTHDDYVVADLAKFV